MQIVQTIKDIPRKIRQGVKSLWMWFPIIWKDRQWDHQFIYMIFRHKLYLTEQLIRHHGHHLNHVKDADQIKVCINLLDRLINDEYHETAFKRHYEKWGTPSLNWKETRNKEFYEGIMSYPNIKTPKDKELETKDFKLASNHEAYLREQDLDLLFKLMRKHIQGWWD